MDAVNDINDTLESLGFAQLLLAFAFLMSYALALSGLLGSTGSRRAWVVTAASAIGFSVLTTPWFHGALLMALALVGLGLFIVAVWLIGALLAPAREQRARDAQTPEAVGAVESPQTFESTRPALRLEGAAAAEERAAFWRFGRKPAQAPTPSAFE
jgi:hypothetical protein